MEAVKQKSDELEVQEKPKKAWVKPEMKKLEIDTGSYPFTEEVNAYSHPS
ncbi:hypothetical protein [Emticicia sp. TH156]|nr:hypothetical protein [Emticicia sp. TH156]